MDAALIKRSEPMMLAILRAKDPWFQPKPKHVEHTHETAPPDVSLSNTTINVGILMDDELETLNRLLKKVGMPDQALLQPGEPDVIDVKAGK